MAAKRRLGRGLDALIAPLEGGSPDGAMEPEEAGILEIPLRKVELNPKQPRRLIDQEELQRLADSIRTSGVIQPVLVRPAGGMYQLVVGERRVRASKLAGRETIPALVRDIPDDKMLELALVENVQRADLNPIERAEAVRRMMAELGLTQEEVGRRIGFGRPTVANMLRLLELSAEIQAMVARGTLSAGHARALLRVPGDGAQLRLARGIVARGLSVRQAERMAARQAGGARPVRIHEPAPHVLRLEEALSESLGTRVEIRQQRNGGTVVVHFGDHEDFERLFGLLAGRDAADLAD